MAFLGKGQGKGLSSAKGNTRCKELALEVYDKASFVISGVSFEEGALALLMALPSAEEDRRNVDSDNTLKFLGGLIANDASQRPSYAEDLLQALPRGCVLQYARPRANDNMSAWAVVVNDSFAFRPGVRCLQIGAPSPSLLGQGINTFMNHATKATSYTASPKHMHAVIQAAQAQTIRFTCSSNTCNQLYKQPKQRQGVLQARQANATNYIQAVTQTTSYAIGQSTSN